MQFESTFGMKLRRCALFISGTAFVCSSVLWYVGQTNSLHRESTFRNAKVGVFVGSKGTVLYSDRFLIGSSLGVRELFQGEMRIFDPESVKEIRSRDKSITARAFPGFVVYHMPRWHNSMLCVRHGYLMTTLLVVMLLLWKPGRRRTKGGANSPQLPTSQS